MMMSENVVNQINTLTQSNMTIKDKIDIKDKSGNDVFFGDKFIAHIIKPSFKKGTIVKVVEDTSEENIACGRNYDVEDEYGNRLWNAYMVITGGKKQFQLT
ncbi:unnamed protein product [marine sediment metagenome]|uniref:Uncharacterized protein n=1 Tax=marine sediment metagenome TaxID=412755 RepID=X0USE0_9ZZZZ